MKKAGILFEITYPKYTTMLTDLHLQFLQQKIHQLRSALFFNMSDAVLKIPTSIITALRVDEVGNIWFFVNRPKQNIQEFDREFPVRLDFFKKGIDYSLKVMGKAYIVNDPEEINNLIGITDDERYKAKSQLLLIKVKIQNAEYFENKPENAYNWLYGFGSKVYKMLFNTQPQAGYRPLHTAH